MKKQIPVLPEENETEVPRVEWTLERDAGNPDTVYLRAKHLDADLPNTKYSVLSIGPDGSLYRFGGLPKDIFATDPNSRSCIRIAR